MSDITWRDAYDDAEGLAEELDVLEAFLVRQGGYSPAQHVRVAAQVLREQAERIAELEAMLGDVGVDGDHRSEGGEA